MRYDVEGGNRDVASNLFVSEWSYEWARLASIEWFRAFQNVQQMK